MDVAKWRAYVGRMTNGCCCGVEAIDKPDHVGRTWRFVILPECRIHGWLVNGGK